VAAVHAEAPTAAATDWRQIVALYVTLERIDPSPVVTLNRAVAVSFADGAATALALVDGLTTLDNLHLYHSTRGDLLARLGRTQDATAAFERARALATNDAERRFLDRRLHGVRGSTP
jgi:RNA polymerase sigma-70 factor (ECF subfamily)